MGIRVNRRNESNDPIQIGVILAQCIKSNPAVLVYVSGEDRRPENLPPPMVSAFVAASRAGAGVAVEINERKPSIIKATLRILSI